MSAATVTPCPSCGVVSSEDYDGAGSCWQCYSKATGTTHDGVRRVVTRQLGEYTPKPTHWLWRDRIPAGELTLLGGDGGLGKSTFAAYLAAAVTTGAVTGLTGSRTAVVVFGEDDPARTVYGRHKAAGADMSRVRILAADEGAGDEPITLPEDLGELRRLVDELHPELLVIDPLGAHVGESIDSHRDFGKGGMRAVLTPLARLAQTTGTTVLVAVHLRKGGGAAADLLAGTKGIRNAARNVLVLAEHPEARSEDRDDGRRILGHDKCNYGPRQGSLAVTVEHVVATDAAGGVMVDKDGRESTVSVIDTIGESEVDYATALAASSRQAVSDDEDGALADAVAFLREELPTTSRALRQAANDAGIAWRTVERARKKIGARSVKTATGWVVTLAREDHGGLGGLDESPVTTGDSKTANGGLDLKTATARELHARGGLDTPSLLDSHEAPVCTTCGGLHTVVAGAPVCFACTRRESDR